MLMRSKDIRLFVLRCVLSLVLGAALGAARAYEQAGAFLAISLTWLVLCAEYPSQDDLLSRRCPVCRSLDCDGCEEDYPE